jgi:hypothetical protein
MNGLAGLRFPQLLLSLAHFIRAVGGPILLLKVIFKFIYLFAF